MTLEIKCCHSFKMSSVHIVTFTFEWEILSKLLILNNDATRIRILLTIRPLNAMTEMAFEV